MQLQSQCVSLLQLQIIVTHLQTAYKLAYSRIYRCIIQLPNINLHLKPYQLQLYNSTSYMNIYFHLLVHPQYIKQNTINIKAVWS